MRQRIRAAILAIALVLGLAAGAAFTAVAVGGSAMASSHTNTYYRGAAPFTYYRG